MSDTRPAGARVWAATALVIAGTLLVLAPAVTAQQYDPSLYSALRWRMIGPST